MELLASQAKLDVKRQESGDGSIAMEELQKECWSLREIVSSSQNDVSLAKENLFKSESELKGSKALVDKLQVQLSNYKNELHETKDQLRNVESHVESLQSTMNMRVTEASRKLEIQESSLTDKQEELGVKLNELELMRGELEQVRQEQTTTLELFHQSESRTGTPKSVVEDDEFSVDVMRDQIVTLALALETSELDRADAMDRIGRERKDNADSLKRLGLLVKRFYSTLSCGDTKERES
uniref:Uncharacterized protein n=1 Tax=Attheya septentrionalis TaxID=420275 RepID=A0A7S2XLZ7_9STRA|mmetsp:Transcript_1946/g.3487  ORF Transcript_1946/g.3487 Transcript_1946/m.3487 type:complete len:239 (+) Transcript_1946:2-718(+)